MRINQKGVGLIEVLVALFVIAIGLLGFAGLQGRSLKINNESVARTNALLLANDMFERIRANKDVALYEDAYSINEFSGPDDITAGRDCMELTCNPIQMARWERDRWLDNVEGVLPGAEGRVVRGCFDDGNRFCVAIRYRFPNSEEFQTFEHTSYLIPNNADE